MKFPQILLYIFWLLWIVRFFKENRKFINVFYKQCNLLKSFQHSLKVCMNLVCMCVACPSVRGLTLVNIIRSQCNFYMLLRFTVECSILKKKGVSLLVYLPGHTKEFHSTILIRGNRLRWIVQILRCFKYNFIDIYQWEEVQLQF